jgi:hypothetical protein
MTFYQQGAQFGLINIDLGDTAESDLERKILDRVGSYGRQIGRIGDALGSGSEAREAWGSEL